MPSDLPAFMPDRRSDVPIFEQICTALRSRIRSGALATGARLPATRALAGDLGVARATVVTAYEQLVAEGYLMARRGSGYTVCAMGEVELPAKGTPTPPADLSERGDLLLEAGQPDMRLFPHRAWAKAVARLCRTRPEDMLMGCGRFGHPELRQAIAAHVNDWRGIAARPDQVLVTSGATEALDICLSALASSTGAVGVEDPGYPPIRRFAQAQGRRIRDLALDSQGAEVPTTGDGTDVVVLTPSHQYPLGGAMSAGRRQEFVRWAAQSQGWIIEDDYDSEFRYQGQPLPSLAGLDGLRRTIYMGSFSKLLSPTLRIGYLVLPEALVGRVRDYLAVTGARASLMPQPALARFMAQGEFATHLRRMRRVYARRQAALLAALPGPEWLGVGPDPSGMHLVAGLGPRLQGRVSDRAIAERATARGLALRALSSHAILPDPPQGLLLGYAGFDEDTLGHAGRTLGALLVSAPRG